MSIFAVIETSTNLCDNVVEWNDAEHPWVAPENHYTINIDGVEVGIGWTYNPDVTTWSAPAVPVIDGK